MGYSRSTKWLFSHYEKKSKKLGLRLTIDKVAFLRRESLRSGGLPSQALNNYLLRRKDVAVRRVVNSYSLSYDEAESIRHEAIKKGKTIADVVSRRKVKKGVETLITTNYVDFASTFLHSLTKEGGKEMPLRVFVSGLYNKLKVSFYLFFNGKIDSFVSVDLRALLNDVDVDDSADSLVLLPLVDVHRFIEGVRLVRVEVYVRYP